MGEKQIDTVHHALGIDDNRNTKIMWMLDEIMDKEVPKATALEMISVLDISQVEKVYLGYMLCKRIVQIRTPQNLRGLVSKIFDI